MGWGDGRFANRPYGGRERFPAFGNDEKDVFPVRGKMGVGAISLEQREWCVGITVGLGGRAVREPPLREGNDVGHGVHPPSPVFTGVGASLENGSGALE